MMVCIRRFSRKATLRILIMLWISTGPAVAASSQIEASLLADIKTSQQLLRRTEQRIVGERKKISSRLRTLEQDVVRLRKRSVVARRLVDEGTLSLSQLEGRLNKWREQDRYQQNLIMRFTRQHGQLTDGNAVAGNAGLVSQLDSIIHSLDSVESYFYPLWQDQDMTLDSGVIASMRILEVGPVAWYWNQDDGAVGLADRGDGPLKASLLLGGRHAKGLRVLAESGLEQRQAMISFDPSLSRAVALAQHAESPLAHVMKGGVWAIPILLFAVFATVIALFKSIQLWRLPKVRLFSATQIQALFSKPSTAVPADVSGMQKRLLDIGVSSSSRQYKDDQLFTELQSNKHLLERWLGAIAITAAVSPLLGLLGTVSGMIETFKMMTLFGSGDPEVVSGGIAQALITTELGLVVAIPALILNAVLSRRVKIYYTELENFAVLLSQPHAVVAEDVNQEVSV